MDEVAEIVRDVWKRMVAQRRVGVLALSKALMGIDGYSGPDDAGDEKALWYEREAGEVLTRLEADGFKLVAFDKDGW